MIPASFILARVMDTRYIKRRRTRGMLGMSIMAIVTSGTYAGLSVFISYNNIDRTRPPPAVDWTDSRYAAGLILYLLTGIIYSGYQIATQWVLGALTNDPAKCARYAGLFKGTTSLGLCAWFIMDGQDVSYRTQQASQFALYAMGLVSLFGITWCYVKDTNYFLEADVIAPRHVERDATKCGLDEQVEVNKE